MAHEQGMALVAVMLLLMVMSALAAALTVSGNSETMIARNHQTAAQARAAAEAGLNHALEVTTDWLQDYQDNGYASASAAMTALLVGPDGETGTTATNADNGSLAGLGIPLTGLALSDLPDVTYEVRLFDEDDSNRGVTLSTDDITRIGEGTSGAYSDANTRLVIRAIGYASGNAVATIEATIAPVELPAIVTNGSLEISGNATISGTEGSVHSNTNLEVSGSPTITGDATASGTYTETGNPTVAGVAEGSQSTKTVPSISASDYLSDADFILTSAGRLTTAGGTEICDASSPPHNQCSNLGYGFEYTTAPSIKWQLSSNSDTIIAGTYYVETDVQVSGSPGSALLPLQMTIIAEGSIDVSGSPDLTPDTPELLFVTDGDLEISGGITEPSTAEGLMLVHEQLKISGNPTLAGQILVEDGDDAHALVTENEISGNLTLVYNGIAGYVDFDVSAWRPTR